MAGHRVYGLRRVNGLHAAALARPHDPRESGVERTEVGGRLGARERLDGRSGGDKSCTDALVFVTSRLATRPFFVPFTYIYVSCQLGCSLVAGCTGCFEVLGRGLIGPALLARLAAHNLFWRSRRRPPHASQGDIWAQGEPTRCGAGRRYPHRPRASQDPSVAERPSTPKRRLTTVAVRTTGCAGTWCRSSRRSSRCRSLRLRSRSWRPRSL